jgi:hypothetical protein
VRETCRSRLPARHRPMPFPSPGRSPSLTARFLALGLLCWPPAASAQEPQSGVATDLPRVQLELDAQGRVLVTVGESAPRPMVRIDDGLMNLGTFGMLGLLGSGGADLVSLTDAVAFFEKQGFAEDTDLLRRIGKAPHATDAAHAGLVRILAVRAAQQRGLKPAIGLLERTLAEPALDPNLREACESAIASLRGASPPTRTRALPPLATALAAVPGGAQIVLRIDSSRLPCAAPLITLGRQAEALRVQQILAGLGDRRFLESLAVRHLELMEFRNCVGYVLANEFGNARVDRVVLAMRSIDTSEWRPEFFVRLEGQWDLDRIDSGLRAGGVDHETDDGEVSIALPHGYVIRCRERVAVLSRAGWEAPRGAVSAAALSAAVDSEAPIAFWWDGDAPVPEAIAEFRISRAALWVPSTRSERVRVTTTWATPEIAAAVAAWTTGLSRLLEAMPDQDEALIALAEAASESEVRRDGRRVDIDIAIPEGDLGRWIALLFFRFGIH